MSLTGNTIQIGDEFISSDSGSSIGTGTSTISSIPVTSGNSAVYDYYVSNGSNARAGSVIAVWDGVSSGSTFTEYSTPDLTLVGSTAGISFSTTISGGNILLQVVVTAGTWTVKVGSRVIF
jgi:hypothetical protein